MKRNPLWLAAFTIALGSHVAGAAPTKKALARTDLEAAKALDQPDKFKWPDLLKALEARLGPPHEQKSGKYADYVVWYGSDGAKCLGFQLNLNKQMNMWTNAIGEADAAKCK